MEYPITPSLCTRLLHYSHYHASNIQIIAVTTGYQRYVVRKAQGEDDYQENNEGFVHSCPFHFELNSAGCVL